MSPESSEMYVEKGWDVVIIKPTALFILCTYAFNQISQSHLSRGIANPFCNIEISLQNLSPRSDIVEAGFEFVLSLKHLDSKDISYRRLSFETSIPLAFFSL